jgi:hypothetical protein
MLRLLVDFDLDFLLAGPAPLVAAAQVPAAAVWIISRAPAPTPGVDLSLMLWLAGLWNMSRSPTTPPGSWRLAGQQKRAPARTCSAPSTTRTRRRERSR